MVLADVVDVVADLTTKLFRKRQSVRMASESAEISELSPELRQLVAKDQRNQTLRVVGFRCQGPKELACINSRGITPSSAE